MPREVKDRTAHHFETGRESLKNWRQEGQLENDYRILPEENRPPKSLTPKDQWPGRESTGEVEKTDFQ